MRTGAELREESGWDGLDFVRARERAQEKRPPLLGCLYCGANMVCESGSLMVSYICWGTSRELLRECMAGTPCGRERVDEALWGSA